MKYFIDTEFLEGPQRESFPVSLFRKETQNTIDLISIGIVAEDGREYYAISKDFNLKEAWGRYDEVVNRHYPMGPEYNKVYWLRKNVLYPIFWNLYQKSYPAKSDEEYGNLNNFMGWFERKGTGMKEFRKLLQEYGKTNKEIAEEVKSFVSEKKRLDNPIELINGFTSEARHSYEGRMACLKAEYGNEPEFYAYYADYDWVVFCWLFGKMMDLPNGFPMYCKDLKQMMDEKQNHIDLNTSVTEPRKDIKSHTNYPKQENEHSAIDDSRWNRKLYEFLKQL